MNDVTKDKVKGWGSKGKGTDKCDLVISVPVGTYASTQNIWKYTCICEWITHGYPVPLG